MLPGLLLAQYMRFIQCRLPACCSSHLHYCLSSQSVGNLHSKLGNSGVRKVLTARAIIFLAASCCLPSCLLVHHMIVQDPCEGNSRCYMSGTYMKVYTAFFAIICMQCWLLTLSMLPLAQPGAAVMCDGNRTLHQQMCLPLNYGEHAKA